MFFKKYFFLLVGFFFMGTLAWGQTEGKIKFKSGTIQIKNKSLKAEFAETEEQQRYGLMNREDLPNNYGMLFIFPDEDHRSFWMKDTFVDLSLAYISAKKEILEIIDMAASKSSTDNPSTYPSQFKAKYVLEVKKGWFKKNKIHVGDKITYSIKK